jgi:hypothetical protein
MKYKEVARKHGQIIMIVIGSFTVISGVILVLFWPEIFDKILFKVSLIFRYYELVCKLKFAFIKKARSFGIFYELNMILLKNPFIENNTFSIM